MEIAVGGGESRNGENTLLRYRILPQATIKRNYLQLLHNYSGMIWASKLLEILKPFRSNKQTKLSKIRKKLLVSRHYSQ